MKDLLIHLEDKPGTLANLSETLGNAGVNIEGGAGIPCNDQGIIHILVSDSDRAKEALQSKGIAVIDEREVLVIEIENQPGALGSITRKFADEGINVNLLYVAANNRLVLGVDNLSKAKSLL